MKTFNKLWLGIVLLTTVSNLYAQNQIWSLPSNFLSINSLGVNPSPLPIPSGSVSKYTGQPAKHCHNAMQDAQGNLLFFIVDDSIYDKEGYLIDRLYYGFPIKGYAETCIIPDPGNCQRYYIALAGAYNHNSSPPADILPYWGVLDLSLESTENPGRYGKLVIQDQGSTINAFHDKNPEIWYYPSPPPNKPQGGVCFAASKLRPDNSRFLFISNGVEVFRYIITSSGLFYDNYSIPLDYASHADQIKSRAEMELVQLQNGKYRLAVPFLAYTYGIVVLVSDLDSNGDLISSQMIRVPGLSAESPSLHGLEFSPSGSVLYITHTLTNSNPYSIQYYDFDNPPITNFFQNYTGVSASKAARYQYSQIELGKDNKLYFVAADRLATLSNPDNPNQTV